MHLGAWPVVSLGVRKGGLDEAVKHLAVAQFCQMSWDPQSYTPQLQPVLTICLNRTVLLSTW